MIFEGFDWIRALITVAFGALAGGLTNRVAVWMLFHPYEAPEPLGRRIGWLQGAIPKNRKRLASSIGGVVGGTLLTPEDLTAELQDEELKGAFDARIRELVAGLVEGEQPSLSDLLPEPVVVEVRALIDQMLGELYEQLLATVESEPFREDATRLLGDLAQGLRDEALSDSLDEERVEELRTGIDAWLERVVESEALERTIRRHLEQAAEHLLRPDRTLEQLIPGVLVEAVERAIRQYLPIAMERLGRLLEDPDTRLRVQKTIHGLLDRFMRDLKFHQRVVAKLIVTEDTVDRVLSTLEKEGTEELGDLLKEAEVQAAMARNVNDAIVEFLRRPAVEVIGSVDSESVQGALDSMTQWLAHGARDEDARAFLLEQLEEAVWKLGDRSWGDVLDLLPARRVGSWLGMALRSDPGRALWDSLAAALAQRILERPIGRLNRFLQEDAGIRLAEALAPPAWDWVTDQVPHIAERIKIADRIEQKIEEFPLEQMESLVRRVSQHELDLIVRLGYVLGAVIGTILVVVTSWLG